METVLRLNKRCKKMDWAFFKKDLQYIFLNQIVSSIPSWTIRKMAGINAIDYTGHHSNKILGTEGLPAFMKLLSGLGISLQ
ncbi:hypothetical protein ACTM9N_13125 [Lachnospiraceae bacterium HCP1S3_A8]